jgi:PucR C-terminal helix-turn-helix domain
VLQRIDVEFPEPETDGWRGRPADEALLVFELTRRLELAERGAPYTAADLDEFARHFRAMAGRGAPLRSVQRFCRATIAHTFTELWGRAEPGDVTELLRMSRWLSRHHATVEKLLVQVYCEQLDPVRRNADRGAAVAEQLLAGRPAGGGDLAVAGYLVVTFTARPPIEPGVAERLPSGTVGTTVGAVRHLMVPVANPVLRDRVWRQVRDWAGPARLRAAGVFADDPSDVPAAAAQGRDLLRAAEAVSLPAGLVGARDLVLESTLVEQPEGLRRLAAVLEPLDADDRLVETLVAFYANDLDRTRTAGALFLSRGGLSLRLDRIAHITGLDPRSTRGIQVLGAALSARALGGADGAGVHT